MPDPEVNAETRVSEAYGTLSDAFAELGEECDALHDENERLRKALRHIARARVLPQWAWQVARAALAETQENAE